jgi:hypothetical protein
MSNFEETTKWQTSNLVAAAPVQSRARKSRRFPLSSFGFVINSSFSFRFRHFNDFVSIRG